MVNKGDTTWMLISSALVLMMSIPALALFYGGLVRTKNMLSLLMQVFMIVCVAAIMWLVVGYSLPSRLAAPSSAARQGLPRGRQHRHLCRNLQQQRLHPRICLRHLPDDLRLHHAGADRGRLCRADQVLAADAVRRRLPSVRLLPIAHMVWFWAGPDFLSVPDYAEDKGLLWGWGALDFAGGTWCTSMRALRGSSAA